MPRRDPPGITGFEIEKVNLEKRIPLLALTLGFAASAASGQTITVTISADEIDAAVGRSTEYRAPGA